MTHEEDNSITPQDKFNTLMAGVLVLYKDSPEEALIALSAGALFTSSVLSPEKGVDRLAQPEVQARAGEMVRAFVLSLLEDAVGKSIAKTMRSDEKDVKEKAEEKKATDGLLDDQQLQSLRAALAGKPNSSC